jgi:lipopolysaccharide biosynthesis glycosyltransferase
MITIVYNITSNYNELTLTSIESIRKFYRSDLEIQFIITGDVQSRTVDNIQYINFYDNDMPLMHQRMMLPDYLSNINRMIYLDSDTLAFTCISKLWSVDLQDNIIAAAPHAELKTLFDAKKLYQLEFDPKDYKTNGFFNAGVMLIDCDLWREYNVTQSCLSMAASNKDNIYARRNEPILNCILNNKWLELDSKWNYRPQTTFKKCYIQHSYGLKSHEKPVHFEF